jgi:hypothetical protein
MVQYEDTFGAILMIIMVYLFESFASNPQVYLTISYRITTYVAVWSCCDMPLLRCNYLIQRACYERQSDRKTLRYNVLISYGVFTYLMQKRLHGNTKLLVILT